MVLQTTALTSWLRRLFEGHFYTIAEKIHKENI
jgi:hypothetical protein